MGTESLHKMLIDTGMTHKDHSAKNVSVQGGKARRDKIDSKFFPWSTGINPLKEDDIGKTRPEPPDMTGYGLFRKKGKGKGKKDLFLVGRSGWNRSRSRDGKGGRPRRLP